MLPPGAAAPLLSTLLALGCCSLSVLPNDNLNNRYFSECQVLFQSFPQSNSFTPCNSPPKEVLLSCIVTWWSPEKLCHASRPTQLVLGRTRNHNGLPGPGARASNSHMILPFLSQQLQTTWSHLSRSAPSSSQIIMESELATAFKLTHTFRALRHARGPSPPCSFLR